MTEKPHVRVVCALLVRNGKIFLQQRPLHVLRGGLWEMPGGKQHLGETDEETLVREIREELQISVVPGRQLASVDVEFPDFIATLVLLYAEIGNQEPVCTAAIDSGWFDLDQIPTPGVPTEEPFLTAARRFLIDR